MKNSGLTLVMMAGLPGAGKTTLAYALQDELGWRVIDKDGYKEELLQQCDDDDRAAIAAYERSFYEIRVALVDQQTSVIFDTAALHLFILDTVNEILNCVAYARLKVILCLVDRDLRNERLRSRKEQRTRVKADPITIADYLQYFDHLPQDKLILFTDTPLTESLARAREYLGR